MVLVRQDQAEIVCKWLFSHCAYRQNMSFKKTKQSEQRQELFGDSMLVTEWKIFSNSVWYKNTIALMHSIIIRNVQLQFGEEGGFH